MNRRRFFSMVGLAGLAQATAPIRATAASAAREAKSLNLKITGLKTFVVNVGNVNWAFCKVSTNQGLIGSRTFSPATL